MIWQGSIKIGFNGKDLKLTIGSRYIVGRAGATGTVSGLRPVGAFELHLIVLLHYQYFEAFVTF
jgi:hypothetical protein